MSEVLDLYNDAQRITQVGKAQRRAFDYWAEHNEDSVMECMAFDTETTGVTPGVPSMLHLGKTDIRMPDFTVFGISLAIPVKDRLALVWARLGTDLYDETAKLLRVRGCKVAHNLRYDLRACKNSGLRVAPKTACTLTMARICWDRRQKFGLEPLSEFICPELSDWELDVKAEMRRIKSRYTRSGHPKGYANYSFLPDKLMREYSPIDSFMCFVLNLRLRPRINEVFATLYKRERRLISIAAKMETRGTLYDRHKSKKVQRKLEKEVHRFEVKLQLMAGKKFNPRSPDQLLQILLKQIKIPKQLLIAESPSKIISHLREEVTSTTDTKLTTDKHNLEQRLAEDAFTKKATKFITVLLELRARYKTLGSYIIPLYKRAQYNSGVIYYNINPTDTRTSRMTATDPGIQTITRPYSRGSKRYNPVRVCFICRPGYANYYFDYEQIEMVVFSLFAGETRLVTAYQKGLDIYKTISDIVATPEDVEHVGKITTPEMVREMFKAVSLALIYGGGIKALMQWLKMGQESAQYLLDRYRACLPHIAEYRDKLWAELLKNGFVKDLFGRHYSLTQRDIYKAPNAVTQGGCAQTFKIACENIDDYLKPRRVERDTHLLYPMHDELIMERRRNFEDSEDIFVHDVSKCMYEIPQLMDRGLQLRIGVAKSVTNWEAKKDFKTKAQHEREDSDVVEHRGSGQRRK